MDAEQQVAPLAQVHRQRHVGRASVQGADLGDDPHGAALREQGDLIALLEPQRHEPRADALRPLPGLLLRDLQPLPVHLLPQIHILRKLVRVLFDEINDRRPIVLHIDCFLLFRSTLESSNIRIIIQTPSRSAP